jgi:hypothetical protein
MFLESNIFSFLFLYDIMIVRNVIFLYFQYLKNIKHKLNAYDLFQLWPRSC